MLGSQRRPHFATSSSIRREVHVHVFVYTSAQQTHPECYISVVCVGPLRPHSFPAALFSRQASLPTPTCHSFIATKIAPTPCRETTVVTTRTPRKQNSRDSLIPASQHPQPATVTLHPTPAAQPRPRKSSPAASATTQTAMPYRQNTGPKHRPKMKTARSSSPRTGSACSESSSREVGGGDGLR